MRNKRGRSITSQEVYRNPVSKRVDKTTPVFWPIQIGYSLFWSKRKGKGNSSPYSHRLTLPYSPLWFSLRFSTYHQNSFRLLKSNTSITVHVLCTLIDWCWSSMSRVLLGSVGFKFRRRRVDHVLLVYLVSINVYNFSYLSFKIL